MADYINNKVISRKLPRSLTSIMERKPNVVIKMDIEGSELEVLTDLLGKFLSFLTQLWLSFDSVSQLWLRFDSVLTQV